LPGFKAWLHTKLAAQAVADAAEHPDASAAAFSAAAAAAKFRAAPHPLPGAPSDADLPAAMERGHLAFVDVRADAVRSTPPLITSAEAHALLGAVPRLLGAAEQAQLAAAGGSAAACLALILERGAWVAAPASPDAAPAYKVRLRDMFILRYARPGQTHLVTLTRRASRLAT
jgi:hypothetical protein